ncbi:hypothetical protein [Achromobacter xylosoxidans]|nr:hypothetical protein [Achromobacter xylosoxidans]BEG75479.1 hypothetical protein HBIAX_02544 [Achromobacter xylosoxidans]
MQLLLKRNALGSLSLGQPSFQVDRTIEDDSSTVVVLNSEIDWGALAISALGKMADALSTATGGELGKVLGSVLAKALFGIDSGGASIEQIEQLLQKYTRIILDALRQEFLEHRWIEAHTQLARTVIEMDSVVWDPARRSVEVLTRIEGEATAAFVQLSTLGPGALAGLAHAGAMRIGLAILVAEATKARTSWEWVQKVADDVKTAIGVNYVAAEKIQFNRLVGPQKSTRVDFCQWIEVRDPPLGPKQMHTRVSMPVYEVIYDKFARAWPRREDPCKEDLNLSDSAFSLATRYHKIILSELTADFTARFTAPYDALSQRLDSVQERVGGILD